MSAPMCVRGFELIGSRRDVLFLNECIITYIFKDVSDLAKGLSVFFIKFLISFF